VTKRSGTILAPLAIVVAGATAPPLARPRRSVTYATAFVLRLAGVGLLVWVAAIHLHLWSEGYKRIPTTGPLFLLDAVAGFGLAALVLLWPRPLAGLLGAGFMLSTLAGLILSIHVGLWGFHESSSAPFVYESIVLESVGAFALLVWTAIALARSTPERVAGGPQ
jgi:hypothetical protein